MNENKEGGSKEDHENWQAPNAENDSAEEVTALDNYEPIAENPIEKVQIGLAHNVGMYDKPTRVVMTLRDGKQVSLPWEKAVDLLPPAFKESSDLGFRAQELFQDAVDFDLAVTQGSDLFSKKDRVVGRILSLAGKETRSYGYAEKVQDVKHQFSDLNNEAFKNLQKMIEVKGLDTTELERIRGEIDDLEREYTKAKGEIMLHYPEVKRIYEEGLARREKYKKMPPPPAP
ncbi:hypothetical protein ACFL04_04120 [Patescibacteria group bacterium]